MGPIPARDSPEAQQPLAIILITGTYHADGVDEVAFDEKGANLLDSLEAISGQKHHTLRFRLLSEMTDGGHGRGGATMISS